MTDLEQLRQDVDALVDAVFGSRKQMKDRLARVTAAPGSGASSAPPIPIDLASQRTELAELEREQAQLRDRQRNPVHRGDPHDERRLVFIEGRTGLLRSHIKVAELGLGIRT